MVYDMLSIVEAFSLAEGDPGAPLLLSNESPEIYKILRLLTGTAQLQFQLGDTEVDLLRPTENYVRLDHNINENSIIQVFDYIYDERPEAAEIVSNLRGIRGKNASFFSELREELSLCVLSIEKSRYTESFLMLYRALERMSSACPLIYVSRQHDFKSAHSFLGGMFKDGKNPGELGILKSFLTDYAKDNDDFKNATLDIPIPDFGGDFAVELSRQWGDVIQREAPYATLDKDTGVISCAYAQTSSLIVTLRNRTFHNLSGQRNFNLFRLGGSDPLFQLFVPYLLRWTAYIFVDFARWQLSSARA